MAHRGSTGTSMGGIEYIGRKPKKPLTPEQRRNRARKHRLHEAKLSVAREAARQRALATLKTEQARLKAEREARASAQRSAATHAPLS